MTDIPRTPIHTSGWKRFTIRKRLNGWKDGIRSRWMAEYGNPDIPEEWKYIKKCPPYQNLKTGQTYPEVFFTTSTRDDKIHPGHAWKMVARMHEKGYPIYYFENIEGGHTGSSTNEQRAHLKALIYTYLQKKLMNPADRK